MAVLSLRPRRKVPRVYMGVGAGGGMGEASHGPVWDLFLLDSRTEAPVRWK